MWHWPGGWLAWLAAVGVVALMLWPPLVVGRAIRLLNARPHPRQLVRVERAMGAYQLAVVLAWAGWLAMGGLRAVRGVVREALLPGWANPPLIDELAVLLPVIGLMLWGWWCYYPIERRLREAALIRGLDRGGALPVVFSRRRFLLQRARHHLGLVLPPLLLIFTWREVTDPLGPGPDGVGHMGEATLLAVQTAGAIVVLVLAPAMLRVVWDLEPLPAGEIRRTLQALCDEAGVGVRDLQLWRSHAGMINAAVVGVARPLRYILLSDGLLESLNRRHVEAVMAHEIAHLRKHHMAWLLAGGLAMLLVLEPLSWWATQGLAAALGEGWSEATRSMLAQGPTLAATLGVWIVGFGYLSRRAEWEADANAARVMHERLSREATDLGEPDWDHDPPPRNAADRSDPTDSDPADSDPAEPYAADPPLLSAPAADAVAGALHRVAILGQMPLRRWTWRHGSIADRQRRLRASVGRPIDRLPAERAMTRWRLGIVAALVLGLALGYLSNL